MREPAGFASLVPEESLRRILSDDRHLSLVCQPIVDLRRGVITGYEALARFDLPLPVPPDVAFAAATRYGLGEELEAMVVRRALALSKQIPPNCFFSINVDPDHLTSPLVFDAIVAHAPLGGIVFELTEQRRASNIENVARCLTELQKLGAFTAVDDAGAGYSGLLQILALRPQFVKVDRALVCAVHADEAKRAMVHMLGEIAERLDAWIVAEGIENEDELRALAQLSVPLGQGNYLSPPEPAWAGLSKDVQSALAGLPNDVLRTNVVEQLVEPCTFCDVDSNWPETVPTCVRLDQTGRPIGLRVVDSNGERVRASHELLRVKRSTTISAVALRSTARSERLRWDPIICIDDLGRFDGIIHVHKLVWALASQANEAAQYEPELEPLAAGCEGS